MANISNQKHKKANPIPILIVEANADAWLLIRAALAQCFPEVAPIWINTPAQAITYLQNAAGDKSRLPGLIIMNVYLPGREEGWAFLKSIKATYNIPVICLSPSSEPADIVQSYNLGAASYIVKPTTYHYWLTCFAGFRTYWWQVVSMPVRT